MCRKANTFFDDAVLAGQNTIVHAFEVWLFIADFTAVVVAAIMLLFDHWDTWICCFSFEVIIYISIICYLASKKRTILVSCNWQLLPSLCLFCSYFSASLQCGAHFVPKYHPGVWLSKKANYSCCGCVNKRTVGCIPVTVEIDKTSPPDDEHTGQSLNLKGQMNECKWTDWSGAS